MAHPQPVFIFPGYYPVYAAMPEPQSAQFRTPFATVTNTVPVPASASASGHEKMPRKRMTPVQVSRMEALFAKTSHPSRDARLAAANELSMDLRSVTVWLQNKRQSLKKAGAGVAKHKAASPRPGPLRRTQSVPDARAVRTWQRTVSAPPARLPRVSLDAFANRSAHQQHVTDAASPPLADVPTRPTTPIREREEMDIWDRMPSSPQGPPSSPGSDLRRIAPLGKRRTLEWACAAERARVSHAARCASPAPSSAADTEDTLEDDELRTPGSSAAAHAPVDKTVNPKVKAQLDSATSDVAEIMLLFATQRTH